MTLFAGATGHADARAQRIRVLARTVATFALTEFFVLGAHARSQLQADFGSSDAAVFGLDANTLVVLQVAGLAEAADDAVASADRAGMGVRAGGRASGAAGQEDFLFFAGGDFRWVGEELLGVLDGFALTSRHAQTLAISQKTFFAEASDDAVLGTDRARIGVGAGRGASGSAGVEFLVFRASRSGLRELHGDFVATGLAVSREDALAFGVLQVTFFAEATDDALEGAKGGWFLIGAIRYAGGAAGLEYGIGAAFFIDGKSR